MRVLIKSKKDITCIAELHYASIYDTNTLHCIGKDGTSFYIKDIDTSFFYDIEEMLESLCKNGYITINGTMSATLS